MSTDNKATAERVAFAQDVAKLKAHPSWGVLGAEVQKRRDAWALNLAKRLIAGESIDQREVDRRSGFWAGASWVLSVVDGSDKEIEAVLRKGVS